MNVFAHRSMVSPALAAALPLAACLATTGSPPWATLSIASAVSLRAAANVMPAGRGSLRPRPAALAERTAKPFRPGGCTTTRRPRAPGAGTSQRTPPGLRVAIAMSVRALAISCLHRAKIRQIGKSPGLRRGYQTTCLDVFARVLDTAGQHARYADEIGTTQGSNVWKCPAVSRYPRW